MSDVVGTETCRRVNGDAFSPKYGWCGLTPFSGITVGGFDKGFLYVVVVALNYPVSLGVIWRDTDMVDAVAVT